tara:strand:- start:1164 stop:2171 length:1008 start_codon:yes stop_codon:yes gene_type:complete
MPFEKVEYEFPNPDSDDIEVEPSSAITVDISGDAPVPKPKPDTSNNEIEIEVVDDTPKADRDRKVSEAPEEVTEEELEDYSDKVRNRIKHFSKGYHDERRAKETALREREELERYAQKLVDENKGLKTSVSKNQSVLLDQAKRTAGSELDEAKRAYKEAYESGDTDAVVDAQESMTTAKIKADRLGNIQLPSLQEEETALEQNTTEQSAPVPVDERANEWAKTNTWFGSDDEMTSLALGLHNKLVKEGMNPQSDDYYDAIDARMQQLFPEQFGEVDKPDRKTSKRQANVVAPATRSTSPKKVTLTRTQVDLAKRLGVDLKDYAKQVAIEMVKTNG